MHTQVYDVSVQFGAEIWATAMTERKIKDAISLVVVPNPNSDISYSTPYGWWGSALKKLGRAAKVLKGIILYTNRACHGHQ